MLDKQKVENFRSDFQNAVQQLEEKYGVIVSLGKIRFDQKELRGTMTARVGDAGQKVSKDELRVGVKVNILHPKADPTKEYTVVKIMQKNVKVQDQFGGLVRVSSGLLKKVA